MPPKIEALFAALLIRANQVVSVGQLVYELWGEHPPRRATASLHVYVSQLRKRLAGNGPDGSIITRPPGYLLRVRDDELDANVFRDLVARGRAHLQAGCYEEASATFKSALALWRGPAMVHLRDGAIAGSFSAWVEGVRHECTEMLVESDLMLGRHRELISFLWTSVIENPLNEAYYRMLMLALYRSDRRAEALQVYKHARRTLATELGLEPCRAMQDLHNAMLSADDRLDHHAAV